MKLEEIRGLSEDDLTRRLEEARQELFNLRFRLATRQLANHREVAKVRKSIARLLTVARERELVAEWEYMQAEEASTEGAAEPS